MKKWKEKEAIKRPASKKSLILIENLNDILNYKATVKS